MRLTLCIAPVLFGLVLLGCEQPTVRRIPDTGTAAARIEPVEEVEPVPVAPSDTIDIPAGILLVGSAPSTRGRRPGAEADLVATPVPAFTVDRLPFPNDPERPPQVGVSRTGAAALCEAEGKRLCTELEWERACRGDSDRAYPSGAQFDLETCSIDPQLCASPYGVLSMGTLAREWTASQGTGSLPRHYAISRGGHSESPEHEHRCGARRALPHDTQSELVGFRCCTTEAPADLSYPVEPERAPLRQQDVDLDALRSQLASIAEVRRFAEDFTPFSPEEMRGIIESEEGSRRTPPTEAWRSAEHSLLVWSPTLGEEVWVLAGSSGQTGLILVLHTTPRGTLEHAASFVFENDPAPIALAHLPARPSELLWSKCWGCGGEGGAIEYDRRRRRVHIRPR